MERTFTMQQNWFENVVRPAIYRRSIFALVIVVLCIYWWWQTKSWAPFVIIALVAIERALEIININKTKNYISSFNATTNNEGILITIGDRNQFYPWSSVQVMLNKDKSNNIRAIKLVDKLNKFSKIKISGVNNIDELASIMLEECNAP